ncbi:MAG: tetratricopeptide repeat protein [Ignavibacteria bacterium]|nr:tetratricopeptide repeat protein [Ignavibacteria bacterium]
MLQNNKKISRKEIRQDKLVTFYYKALAFIEEKKNILLSVVGGAIVVILVVVFLNYRQNKNNDAASFAFSQVMKIYEVGAYQEAIDGQPGTKIMGLKKIVDDFGSTDFGQVAKIYLGHSYYNLRKFDLALKAYEDFSGGNDYLKAAAYAGEAASYEALNNPEKAAGLYVKAAKVSSNNVLNPQYLINAGINYIALGKKDDAKEIFETVKRDYSKSPYSREVDRYMAQVE